MLQRIFSACALYLWIPIGFLLAISSPGCGHNPIPPGKYHIRPADSARKEKAMRVEKKKIVFGTMEEAELNIIVDKPVGRCLFDTCISLRIDTGTEKEKYIIANQRDILRVRSLDSANARKSVRNNATFRVRQGLWGNGTVSLESMHKIDHFVVINKQRVTLKEKQASEDFKKRASFLFVPIQ